MKILNAIKKIIDGKHFGRFMFLVIVVALIVFFCFGDNSCSKAKDGSMSWDHKFKNPFSSKLANPDGAPEVDAAKK
jgi:hypothetical protein